MLKSFINWLDSHISREEPSSVIKSLIGLMTFAGLLGTVFGNQAIRVGAFIVVIMFVLSVILALLADRRRLTKVCEWQRAQITRYCTHLVESNPDPQFSIDCWRQWVFVQPNGDVREVLNLNALVLSERAYFIRFTARSLWNQPQKYLDDVQVTIRNILAVGENDVHRPLPRGREPRRRNLLRDGTGMASEMSPLDAKRRSRNFYRAGNQPTASAKCGVPRDIAAGI